MDIKDNLRYVDSKYSDRPWPMRNDHILTLFGLNPNSPIPPDYSAEKKIGNVWVFIYKKGEAKIKRRVVARCPHDDCHKLVCAGHLDQHMKVHNDKRRKI